MLPHTGNMLAYLLFVLPAAHMDIRKGACLRWLISIWPSLCQYLLSSLSSNSAPVCEQWLYHAWMQMLKLCLP